MGKYISDEIIQKMTRIEGEKKNSGGTYFSSKDDNAEFFNKSAGESLKIVGLEPTTFQLKDTDGKPIGEPKGLNVVYFDDGHQMSTSRFFTAKGIKWPVGGNRAKIAYLAQALNQGVELSVVPAKVESETKTYKKDGKDEEFQLVTYYFEPTTFSPLAEEEEKKA